MNSSKYTIAISPKSIAYLIFIPLGMYFLWTIRDLIFSLLIGFILMSALRPAVSFLTKAKTPRTLAVILVYLLFILFFIVLISLIIPPIIYETTNLIKSLPLYIQGIFPEVGPYIDTNDISRLIPNVTNNILDIISIVFSNTLFVITTLFFGLYFLLEETLLNDFLKRYFENETVDRITSILHNAEMRMASWFWGEIALMMVVGLLTYVGLNLIGIKYALPLAVLAGLLEVVPNIGPTISAIPAILIGFGTSNFMGFSALALSVIVQQLENSLIVPMIMKRAVGINPIVTLITLIVGGRIGGVVGVLLAIPLFLFAETIISELLHNKTTTIQESVGIKLK